MKYTLLTVLSLLILSTHSASAAPAMSEAVAHFHELGFASAEQAEAALAEATEAARAQGLVKGEAILCGEVESTMGLGVGAAICAGFNRYYTIFMDVKVAAGISGSLGAYYLEMDDTPASKWCYFGADIGASDGVGGGVKFMNQVDCKNPFQRRGGSLTGFKLTVGQSVSLLGLITVKPHSY